jgi:hypothetical protein
VGAAAMQIENKRNLFIPSQIVGIIDKALSSGLLIHCTDATHGCFLLRCGNNQLCQGCFKKRHIIFWGGSCFAILTISLGLHNWLGSCATRPQAMQTKFIFSSIGLHI